MCTILDFTRSQIQSSYKAIITNFIHYNYLSLITTYNYLSFVQTVVLRINTVQLRSQQVASFELKFLLSLNSDIFLLLFFSCGVPTASATNINVYRRNSLYNRKKP